MNRRLLVLGLWVSILSFFGCKPESKEIVSFSDFYESPSSGVYVKFEDRFELLSVIDVKSKTRLQSKTTTIINLDVICEANIKGVLLILPREKRINRHLKTTKDREPYVDKFEQSLINSRVDLIQLEEFLFELDTNYSEFYEATVLRQVSK